MNLHRDKDAGKIRQLRDDGQSYSEIADELGRPRSNIVRIANALGRCAGETVTSRMEV